MHVAAELLDEPSRPTHQEGIHTLSVAIFITILSYFCGAASCHILNYGIAYAWILNNPCNFCKIDKPAHD